MPTGKLEGKRFAILATDGYEESELLEPWKALKEAGAAVDIVSLEKRDIQGYMHHEPGKSVTATEDLDSVDADDYDGLVLPGGVRNPDALRTEKKAVSFVRAFFEQGKPIAAICHGPWTLIDAGVVEGRRMTSWPSLRADLSNAGAQWVDEEVVVDQGLVTSRKPDDLKAFCARMIEEFAEGSHERNRGSARPETRGDTSMRH